MSAGAGGPQSAAPPGPVGGGRFRAAHLAPPSGQGTRTPSRQAQHTGLRGGRCVRVEQGKSGFDRGHCGQAGAVAVQGVCLLWGPPGPPEVCGPRASGTEVFTRGHPAGTSRVRGGDGGAPPSRGTMYGRWSPAKCGSPSRRPSCVRCCEGMRQPFLGRQRRRHLATGHRRPWRFCIVLGHRGAGAALLCVASV